ncbi:MAG: tetratricopeptide repeat protein [Methylomicrobium sp.]|nr:tetratricopeptide repeat protein [Methylomicrobium sp.]
MTHYSISFKPIITSLLLMLIILDANAEFDVSDTELAMLPPYCAARYGKTSPEQAALWQRRIGKNWIHMHHYCHGLRALNNSMLSTDKNKRTEHLNRALNQFDYVLEHGSKRFPLLPELHAKKGEAYVRLNQTGQAVKEYNTAISINPKYTKAYAGLSNLYRKQNQKQEAITILKKGLKYNPNSKVLKLRLQKLTQEQQ